MKTEQKGTMGHDELGTSEINTWCPGCTNHLLLNGVKKAVNDYIKESGKKKEEIAMVTGIGCHAKIFDYLNLGGIYGLHGRVLPTALGIKLGNPNLEVIGFGGDGDTYAEGMEHFVHSCRYNADMTMIVHDNRVFALTTGQTTPTSELGQKGKTTPLGVFEKPLNPLRLALTLGATFVARISAVDVDFTAKIIKEAIKHRGFSFVEVLQPCIKFHNDLAFLTKSTYKIENHNTKDLKAALEKANEWDYEEDGKIALGIFYQEERKTLENEWPQLKALKDKKIGWNELKRKIDVKKLMS
jgi:2-oxoglutarate ferredoxin oxidoreductase subunit beta